MSSLYHTQAVNPDNIVSDKKPFTDITGFTNVL
jgi:hypothetical protein